MRNLATRNPLQNNDLDSLPRERPMGNTERSTLEAFSRQHLERGNQNKTPYEKYENGLGILEQRMSSFRSLLGPIRQ